MSSQTSLIARNVRIQEWADMIHECNNRPDDMTVTQWCSEHGISKCNYYYRLAAVRKACLDKLPPEVKQAVVPVPATLLNDNSDNKTACADFLNLNVNGITIEVHSDTSTELLAKVLRVVANVK